MKLVDVRDTLLDEPVPAKHLDRDASQMWRPHCQNDAWLPAEQVFFCVLQLPHCGEAELPGMVELQLDKISPLPSAQTVWTFERVPVFRTDRAQQTVVVMIAERSVVERYAGELERVGYRPDRMEPAVLHQVMAAPQGGALPDGAWIYPRFTDSQVHCTVAWWDEGVLQNITQISLSSREHLNELTSHLTATTWAGELEGWLTGETDWHLVAVNDDAEEWLGVLNDWAGKGVQVEEPPESNALAAAAAARAERPLVEGNLLPADLRARYHRDDVDRVWGNVLVWSVMLYAVLLSVYFVMKTRVSAEESAAYADHRKAVKLQKELKELGVKRRLLEEQLELRWTALNVFKAVAEHIPQEVTLDSLVFSESRNNQGNNITLRGRVSQGDSQKLQDYSEALAKVAVDEQGSQPLFAQVQPPNMDARAGGYLDWYIICLLRREEGEP